MAECTCHAYSIIAFKDNPAILSVVCKPILSILLRRNYIHIKLSLAAGCNSSDQSLCSLYLVIQTDISSTFRDVAA